MESNLTEGLSSVVYHATNTDSALAILQGKRFKLTSMYNNSSELGTTTRRDKLWYMSVTRSKLGSYHKNVNEGVMFVLNGDYLNRHYSGHSVSYWNSTSSGKPLKYGKDETKDTEFEDRVFSNEPDLVFPKDPSDLIKEIHITANSSRGHDPGFYDHDRAIGSIIFIAKKMGIPYWIYETKSYRSYDDRAKKPVQKGEGNYDWRMLSKKDSIPFSQFKDRIKKGFDRHISIGLDFNKKKISSWTANNNRDMVLTLKAWRELFFADTVKEKLSDKAKDLLYKVQHRYNPKEILDQSIVDLRKKEEPELRREINKMQELFKSMNFKDTSDFIYFLTKKWSETQYTNYAADQEMIQKNIDRLRASFGVRHKYPVAESHVQTLVLFHGSNKKFDHFSGEKKRITNDFFGGGIGYFTDNQTVGMTYAKAMAKKYGGTEYLYKVELTFQKIFDVDYVFEKGELTQFLKHVKAEDFARGAGLITPMDDKYSVISKMQTGSIALTGLQVFRGLSRGMVNSNAAEDILKKQGYDGLRYNGGVNMDSARHSVYCAYYPQSIKILKLFEIKRKVMKEAIEMPDIGYLTYSRDMLPQIKDYASFLHHLDMLGISYEKSTRESSELKATQMDGFRMYKVQGILDSKKTADPIIISRDGFILDGHHRWIACHNTGESINVYVVDLPILELIKIGLDFTGLDIPESFEYYGIKVPKIERELVEERSPTFLKVKKSINTSVKLSRSL